MTRVISREGRRPAQLALILGLVVVAVGVTATIGYTVVTGTAYRCCGRPATLAPYADDTQVTGGVRDMAFDGTDMWVISSTMSSTSTITRIGPDGAVLGTYSVPRNLQGLAFDGTNMWSTDAVDESVVRITPTGTVSSYPFTEGTLPTDITFDGTNLWVAASGSKSVLKFNLFGQCIGTVNLASTDAPTAIAYDGTNVWTANYSSDSASRVAPAGSVTRVPLPAGSKPTDITFDGTNLWTANSGTGSVTKITPNLSVPTYTILAGNTPSAIALDQPGYDSGTGPIDGNMYMWVANENRGTVSKVNATTAAVIASYPTTAKPTALVFDGENMWVGSGKGAVARIRAR